jgi:hypothetical protein
VQSLGILINPTLTHYLPEAWQAIQTGLKFIGGTAVVGFFVWLWKRRQENFADVVLDMFAHDKEKLWKKPKVIHTDFIANVILKGVPAWVVFPPLGNRKALWKWRFRSIPYQVRYIWRSRFLMPSEAKVERTILNLWKRGLLIRAKDEPEYYRIKSG